MGEDKQSSKSLSSDSGRAEDEQALESDKGQRIGSAHGAATDHDEAEGYARDIKAREDGEEVSSEVRTRQSGLVTGGKGHPSRSLELRGRGYGIGGGYERPYNAESPKAGDSDKELYGPLPHSGYYGAGSSSRPFKIGQASFNDELAWYKSQYGERTSGYDKKK